MNDFIAWDKEKKIFVPQGEIVFSFHGDTSVTVTPNCMEYIGDTCHDNYNENRFIIFKDIGLKDINGKSIYADSSIIEFVHIGRLSNHALKKVGIFKFIKKDLQYRVIDLECNKDGLEVESPFHKLCAFKIIDTIQENKLGLIK